jgi:hypothetical protein
VVVGGVSFVRGEIIIIVFSFPSSFNFLHVIIFDQSLDWMNYCILLLEKAAKL